MIPRWLFGILRNRSYQGISFFFIVILLANINPIVDKFLHPEIPYFDTEHLIVGGVYAALGTFLFAFNFLFLFQLENALERIESYEKILPICSYCKKIRVNNADPHDHDSWKPIESYLHDVAQMHFTHGICPVCRIKVLEEIKPGEN